MVVTDSNTKFVDKAGIDHAIGELKKLIEDSQSGDIDLSDYVTQEQLQTALDSLDINIDLSAYATKAELQQAIASIDLSDYYTKAETYNKEEVNHLIPTVTNGKDGEDGFSPIATVTKSGNTATITITDKNGTTAASISDGEDGTGGGSSGGGEVYSTEKTAIGTWIDGRTIYRKMIVTDGFTSNTGKNIEFDTDFDIIVNLNVMGVYSYNGTNTYYPLSMAMYDNLNISSNSTTNIKNALKERCLYVYMTQNTTGNKIIVYPGTFGARITVYITVEYIKPISEAT